MVISQLHPAIDMAKMAHSSPASKRGDLTSLLGPQTSPKQQDMCIDKPAGGALWICAPFSGHRMEGQAETRASAQSPSSRWIPCQGVWTALPAVCLSGYLFMGIRTRSLGIVAWWKPGVAEGTVTSAVWSTQGVLCLSLPRSVLLYNKSS